jgi:hypothetical protein
MLKAPGNWLSKLKCDKLLSSFAFDFNLRCYNEGLGQEVGQLHNASPRPSLFVIHHVCSPLFVK